MFYRPKPLIYTILSLSLSFNTTAAPDYEPPSTGAPTHRTGAGTRSDVSSTLQLQLLIHQQQQNVISAQPILFWKVSQALQKPAQFLLQNIETSETLLELEIPINKAGIQMLDLSHYNIVLETGKQYEWAITIPPQADLKSPLIMGATIQRQTSDTALQHALLNAEDKVSIYQKANLWYEALAHAHNNDSQAQVLQAADLN